jgi:hypothetical protein
MSKVINLFAGPGAGKSSTMAQLFGILKWRGVRCEMAPEFAKELVWGKRFATLDDQVYIFGKQHHRIFRLCGQVDVVITDSPLPLSIIYDGSYNEVFHRFIWDAFDRFDNINFFLERRKSYDPQGRMQTEIQAQAIDERILGLLDGHRCEYTNIVALPENIGLLATTIISMIGEKNV